jgi:pyruvate formate lyase activating enzyme
MDSDRHRRFTGVPNELILENLNSLARRGHHIILRVPLIPGVNDDNESIRQIGVFAAALPRLQGVDILPYHHIGLDKYARLNMDYKLTETRPPSDERLAEAANIFNGFGLPTRIGG